MRLKFIRLKHIDLIDASQRLQYRSVKNYDIENNGDAISR